MTDNIGELIERLEQGGIPNWTGKEAAQALKALQAENQAMEAPQPGDRLPNGYMIIPGELYSLFIQFAEAMTRLRDKEPTDDQG